MILLHDIAQLRHRRKITLGDMSDIYAAVKYHGERACDVAAQRGLSPSNVITILHNGPYDVSIDSHIRKIDKAMEIMELKTKEFILGRRYSPFPVIV